jgi:homocysteine S-methyltransferase
MKPFLDALAERVLVCDGAMGTMLYARGVFINRCFDALNVGDPERVLKVHHEYLRAGADVIETNTFGANRVKLRGFGLADQLHAINLEGARLARRAAGTRAYVAGAIGPLGVRIEPWGKIGRDEAEGYFREQAAALAEGNVDLFILETFRDINEIGAAIAAVRSVSSLPIVAQVTIEEDGNSRDGTPPEQFAPVLAEFGPDVIGLNCSIGPAPMLETIERLAAVTTAPLSAQPNAGRPRDIEGRNIYLTSPEYMASYARRFIASGVRLVGGCCGTTPEHIRQIKAAVTRATAAEPPRGTAAAAAVSVAMGPSAPVVPLRERSRLANALAERRFVTVVELSPPHGFVSDALVDQACALQRRGVDAVLIAEDARGGRMSALALAVLIQQRASIEAVLQYACRDRNLLGMQSDLLGAHAMGLRNLVLVTGNDRPLGDYPDATVVYDVDSIGLTNVVRRLNEGLDVGGQAIGAPTGFHIGVHLNSGAEDLDHEIRRFEYKVAAGAEFAVTGPVFDKETFDRLQSRIAHLDVPLIVGLRPFESLRNAEFMANELPGIRVPDHVLERMRNTQDADAAAAEGVSIARELAVALKPAVQGVHISVPAGRIDAALDVLAALR